VSSSNHPTDAITGVMIGQTNLNLVPSQVQSVQAQNVTSSGLAIGHRDLIIALAARHRLPAVYPFRIYVTGGGLISYGADPIDPHRRAARLRRLAAHAQVSNWQKVSAAQQLGPLSWGTIDAPSTSMPRPHLTHSGPGCACAGAMQYFVAGRRNGLLENCYHCRV
jgi:hypothetical protein